MTCETCPFGQYGAGAGAEAECTACPADVCTIEGLDITPATCVGITGCVDIESNLAKCSCPIDSVKDATTDVCTECPQGQVRQDHPDFPVRTLDTLGNYSVWEEQQGICIVSREGSDSAVLIGVIAALVVVVVAFIVVLIISVKKRKHEEGDVWRVMPSELIFSDPPEILGRGTFGLVVLAEYRGTKVAVKRVIPPKSKAQITDSVIAAKGAAVLLRGRTASMDMVPKNASDIAKDSRHRTSSSSIGSCDLPQSIFDVPNFTPGENRIEKSLIHPKNKVAVTYGVIDAIEPSALRRASSSFDSYRNDPYPDAYRLAGLGGSSHSASGMSDLAHVSDNRIEAPTRRGSNDDRGHKTVILKPGESTFKGLAWKLENFSSIENSMAAKSCDEATHSRLVKDFMTEMRHLSKLRHPCITTVMGAVIELGSERSLIFEYMDRGSLNDILHNDTLSLDGDVLLPILQDICQGLRFLHSANPSIIHGDLKSANILVDSKSRAKIADFGLTQKKKVGIVGTPFWMSPELLRGECGNTTASDVYSFGVILFEVYSRKDPYHNEADDVKTVLLQVCDPNINKRPPVPPACPDTIGVIMRECLDGDPAARPTFEELDMRLKRERVENVEPGDMHLTVQTKSSDRLNMAESFMYEIFPRHIADALREGRKVEPEHHDCVTVFFSDIVNFTTISQELGHKKVATMLHRLYSKFDALSEKHAVFKIEVIG
jgi:serine/threonine protein kinase